MKTRLILKPGQKGTKKLVTEYGERLVAVRYRYDETRRRRFKTVELVIEEADWTPPSPKRTKPSSEHGVSPHAIFGVRVDLHETELQTKVKMAGGVWNRQKKLWEIEYQHIERLGIKDRMVEVISI